jgi:hypothetical protein
MDQPDFLARVVEVLREQTPHEGDRISRKVLRLFTAMGASAEPGSLRPTTWRRCWPR